MLEAQSVPLPHLDFLSALVTDELTRRADRLIVRRVKQAAFRDAAINSAASRAEPNRRSRASIGADRTKDNATESRIA